jgi:uncharacterized protein (TIGR03067 family)
MKRAIVAVAVLAACGLAFANAPQGGDRDKLQGTWELSKMTFMGKDFPLPADAKLTLIFKGGEVTAKQTNKPDEKRGYTVVEGKDKQPSVMTVAKTEKEAEMKGIFKIEGDTMTFAMTKPGDPAPKDFNADNAMIMTFKKGKDGK